MARRCLICGATDGTCTHGMQHDVTPVDLNFRVQDETRRRGGGPVEMYILVEGNTSVQVRADELDDYMRSHPDAIDPRVVTPKEAPQSANKERKASGKTKDGE